MKQMGICGFPLEAAREKTLLKVAAVYKSSPGE